VLHFLVLFLGTCSTPLLSLQLPNQLRTSRFASALNRLIRALTDLAEDTFTRDGVKFRCLDFLKEEWDIHPMFLEDTGIGAFWLED
jgi:hypothetical protein